MALCRGRCSLLGPRLMAQLPSLCTWPAVCRPEKGSPARILSISLPGRNPSPRGGHRLGLASTEAALSCVCSRLPSTVTAVLQLPLQLPGQLRGMLGDCGRGAPLLWERYTPTAGLKESKERSLGQEQMSQGEKCHHGGKGAPDSVLWPHPQKTVVN